MSNEEPLNRPSTKRHRAGDTTNNSNGTTAPRSSNHNRPSTLGGSKHGASSSAAKNGCTSSLRSQNRGGTGAAHQNGYRLQNGHHHHGSSSLHYVCPGGAGGGPAGWEHSKYTRFFGAVYTFLGCMWLCIVFGMYIVSGQLYTHGLIEARWLLSPILFTGLACFGLQRLPRSTAMICSVSVLALFSAAGSIVSLVVYCANLHKIISRHMALAPQTTVGYDTGVGAGGAHADDTDPAPHQKAESTLSHEAHRTEKRFVQLAVGLILIAFFAIIACAGLIWHLWDLGRRSHSSTALTLAFKRNLLLCTASLFLLSIFNLTIIGNLLSFQKLAFLQFYAVQDLLCTACLLLTIIGSVALLVSFRGVTANAIVCYMLLSFFTCQIVHEIHATWGAYYVALFMQRSLHGMHQLMVPLNFMCHIVRLFISAYIALSLYIELNLPLSVHVPFGLGEKGLTIGVGVQRLLRAGSGACLLLGIVHALLDVFYTNMHDLILRSLLAFSGASIFYATLAGISLSLYYRFRYAICLIASESLLVLWAVSGLHNVYTYLSLTYTYILATPHDNADIHHPSYMTPGVLHFLEAIVSLAGMTTASILLFLIMRLCYLGRVASGRAGGAGMSNYTGSLSHSCAKILTIAMGITTIARLLITNSVHSQWNIFDINLIHGGRDILLDLVLVVALGAVSCPGLATGDHWLSDWLPTIDLPWVNTFSILLLLIRAVTTMNSLDMETAYLQLLIFYTRAATPRQTSTASGRELFTRPHLAALTANHALELVHWTLDIAALVTCCLIQERLFRYMARHPPDTPLFTTSHTPMIETAGGGRGGRSFEDRYHQNQNPSRSTTKDQCHNGEGRGIFKSGGGASNTDHEQNTAKTSNGRIQGLLEVNGIRQQRQPTNHPANSSHTGQNAADLSTLEMGIENPVYDPTNAASKLIESVATPNSSWEPPPLSDLATNSGDRTKISSNNHSETNNTAGQNQPLNPHHSSKDDPTSVSKVTTAQSLKNTLLGKNPLRTPQNTYRHLIEEESQSATPIISTKNDRDPTLRAAGEEVNDDLDLSESLIDRERDHKGLTGESPELAKQ